MNDGKQLQHRAKKVDNKAVLGVGLLFMGCRQDKANERNPHTVDELKDCISDAFKLKLMGIGICVVLYVRVFWTDMKIVARLKVDILFTSEIK